MNTESLILASAGGILGVENKFVVYAANLLCEITDLFFQILPSSMPICFLKRWICFREKTNLS